MALNYTINFIHDGMTKRDLDGLITLLDRHVEIGYKEDIPLEVMKCSAEGSVQILPSQNYPNLLWSVKIRETGGNPTRITLCTAHDVVLSIGKEDYHIFYSRGS